MKHHDMCKVLFFPPLEKEPKISWLSFEDMADFPSREKRKSNNFNNEEKELKKKGLYEVATFTHDNGR